MFVTMPNCIIPAAGRSRRMKKWKPGLPWVEATVIEAVVDVARSAGCRVIIMGGERTGSIRELMANRRDVDVYQSRRWRYGMDATIREGLAHLSTDCFFVVPADMPLVRPDDYGRLLALSPKGAARPLFDGRPGHPVLLSSRDAERIRKSQEGLPLRFLFEDSSMTMIPWNHSGVVVDLDTPREYQRLISESEGS